MLCVSPMLLQMQELHLLLGHSVPQSLWNASGCREGALMALRGRFSSDVLYRLAAWTQMRPGVPGRPSELAEIHTAPCCGACWALR